MSLFDAMNVAESAMSVHRYRTEIAAQNIANIHTPGYRRKEVELRDNAFASAMDAAGGSSGANADDAPTISNGGVDAARGAVRVAGTHAVDDGPYDERQQALLATSDMLRAKSAFELNAKAATLMKSMSLSALEIGRGS